MQHRLLQSTSTVRVRFFSLQREIGRSKRLLEEQTGFSFQHNKQCCAANTIPQQHFLTAQQLREQWDHSSAVSPSSRLQTLCISTKGWQLFQAYTRKKQDTHTNQLQEKEDTEDGTFFFFLKMDILSSQKRCSFSVYKYLQLIRWILLRMQVTWGGHHTHRHSSCLIQKQPTLLWSFRKRPKKSVWLIILKRVISMY